MNKLRIVLLNGPPGSGKDTLADAFINKYRVLGIIAKGDPSFVVEKAKFAAPIKRAQAAFFDMYEDDLDIEKDNPILPGQVKPRRGLINLSEIWAKPLFGVDVFGQILAKEIRNGMEHSPPTAYTRLVIVSDGGFVPEAQVLINEFGDSVHVVKLYRQGTDFSSDSRQYLPEGTVPLTNMWRLGNNGTVTGLLIDFEHTMREILKDG